MANFMLMDLRSQDGEKEAFLFGGQQCIYLNILVFIQCSKLRFYFVHLPGAKTQKMVHPATCLCVIHYIYTSRWEKHAHTGCTGLRIHALSNQNVHTWSRVPPTFEHCF